MLPRMDTKKYLGPTPLLDFDHPAIAALIASRGWPSLSEYDRIGAAYDFVRDEIVFGYNASDDLPASRVLADGYGQCNTKGVLLMALLRAIRVPCRFHGFTIDNTLQRGAIPASVFWLAPKYILHSWVEVLHEGRWIHLEGFILDARYLSSVQRRFSEVEGAFSGYGAATPCLSSPPVDWSGSHTYIQREGIHDDFGVFDDPDSFYARHGTNLSGIKRWLYARLIRHAINRNVGSIRREWP